MKRFVMFAVLAACVMLGRQLAFAGTTVAAGVVVSPDVVARAQTAFAQIADGKLDRSTLTSDLNDQMTDDVRAALRSAATALPGTPTRFFPIAQTDNDGITTTVFRLKFDSGYLDFTFGIDDKIDRIARLYFTAGPAL